MTGGCNLPSSPCAGARRQSWPSSARVYEADWQTGSASPTSDRSQRAGTDPRTADFIDPGAVSRPDPPPSPSPSTATFDPVLLRDQPDAGAARRPRSTAMQRRMVFENQITETIVPWLEGRALKLEFGP